jgi:hypothetical protein
MIDVGNNREIADVLAVHERLRLVMLNPRF